MKKMYSKPEILFESFVMNVNIASSCDIRIKNPTSGECGIEFGDDIIFVDGVTACMNNEVVVDGTGGFCYHNPTETSNLFDS